MPTSRQTRSDEGTYGVEVAASNFLATDGPLAHANRYPTLCWRSMLQAVSAGGRQQRRGQCPARQGVFECVRTGRGAGAESLNAEIMRWKSTSPGLPSFSFLLFSTAFSRLACSALCNAARTTIAVWTTAGTIHLSTAPIIEYFTNRLGKTSRGCAAK